MADYYLQFSEVIPHLNDDEAAWLAGQLQSVAIIDGVEFVADDLPTCDLVERASWVGPKFLRSDDGLKTVSDEPDFSFALDDDKPGTGWGRYLWLYSDCHGDLDQVAELVQQFLKKFRPKQTWTLGYASTCSKPRVGEFGGGAMVVTAESVEWYDGRAMAAEDLAAAGL